MVIEIKDKVVTKEVRRAKRKKIWLNDNIVPLSTKESKSLKNKEYHQRTKIIKQESKDPYFNQNYKYEIQKFITTQHYTHVGSLTYQEPRSMFGAYKDAIFLFELLRMRSIIYNYFFVVEFEINQTHTHFVLNTDYTTKINSKVYSVFNGKYEKGFVYIEVFENSEHYNKTIDYFVDKLNANNRCQQSQIDYWSIGF